MPGCEDVRPSLGPPRCKGSPPGREPESQGQQRAGAVWGHPGTRRTRAGSMVGRQHRRITHLAVLVEWAGPQASVYLTFLLGAHTIAAAHVCRSWAWRRNEPLLHLTNSQLGRSFLVWWPWCRGACAAVVLWGRIGGRSSFPYGTRARYLWSAACDRSSDTAPRC